MLGDIFDKPHITVCCHTDIYWNALNYFYGCESVGEDNGTVGSPFIKKASRITILLNLDRGEILHDAVVPNLYRTKIVKEKISSLVS